VQEGKKRRAPKQPNGREKTGKVIEEGKNKSGRTKKQHAKNSKGKGNRTHSKEKGQKKRKNPAKVPMEAGEQCGAAPL